MRLHFLSLKNVRLASLLLLLPILIASELNAAQKVDLSRFIPADVMQNLNSLDSAVRDRVCQGIIYNRFQLNSLKPEQKIEGLSSQMKNTGSIFYNLDQLAFHFSEGATAAYVRNDDYQKEFLIKILTKFASANAYKKTKNCALTKDCTQWKTQPGTDLSDEKDYGAVMTAMVSLGFSYYTVLYDFKREQYKREHQLIQKWIDDWYDWIEPGLRATDPDIHSGIGGLNFQLWSMPVYDLSRADEKSFNLRLQNISNKLSSILLDDGSIEYRTVRGSRATWYHYQALNEILFALEMMRANGIDKYPQFHERLSKSAEIFLNTVDDIESGRNDAKHPAYIYRWAKQDFRSAGDPTVQDFQWSLLSSASNWLFIYLIRYPDDPNAERIRKFVFKTDLRFVGDGITGLNTGCLYRLMDPKLLEYELKRSTVSIGDLENLVTLPERTLKIEQIQKEQKSGENLPDSTICIFAFDEGSSRFRTDGRSKKYVDLARKRNISESHCRELMAQ